MDRPKQPAPAFNRFFQETILKDSEARPMSSILKICSQRWRELPEEEKAVFENAYNAEILIYKEELQNWEVEMINSGNIHLVRKATLVKSVETARRQTLMESARNANREKKPPSKRKCSKPFRIIKLE